MFSKQIIFIIFILIVAIIVSFVVDIVEYRLEEDMKKPDSDKIAIALMIGLVILAGATVLGIIFTSFM